jgi:hypothetical protein
MHYYLPAKRGAVSQQGCWNEVAVDVVMVGVE